MNISESDLETILQRAAPPTKTRPQSNRQADSANPAFGGDLQDRDKASKDGDLQDKDISGAADLQDVAYGMRSFIDKISSHSGVEFPW